jgi:hypothetical protein
MNLVFDLILLACRIAPHECAALLLQTDRMDESELMLMEERVEASVRGDERAIMPATANRFTSEASSA